MEEVGVEVSRPLYYIESNSFISDKGQLVIDIIFLCKYEKGEPKCMSADEVSAVYWMTNTEILKNKSAPMWLKESIGKAENIRFRIESSN